MMTYLESAIGYAEQLGWPIFPANRKTKRPLIKTGRDHAEHASRDPAQIRQWFAIDFPDAAIAMPTGAASGVVVIDADAKHDGENLLRKLEFRLGALPRNMVVRTQSGGIHVYTQHPGQSMRISSSAGALVGPGIDIRADGGIVLLPPSTGYAWEVAIGQFAPLPETWVAELRTNKRCVRARVDIGPITYSGTVDIAACRDALRARRRRYRTSGRDGDGERGELLDRIIEGRALAPIGARDESVTRAGWIVGCLLPDIGPDAAEVIARRSLLAIPVPDGDPEDHAHWCRKLRTSYERGARRHREDLERQRRLWLEFAESGRRLS